MSSSKTTTLGTHVTRLGDPKSLASDVANPDGFVTTISSDGLSVGVMFNGKMIAEVQAGSGPDTAVASTTFYFPVSVPDPQKEKFRGYAAHVRGNVMKGGGSRVAVMMDLGGASRGLEFPYGKSANEDFQADLFSFEGAAIHPNGGDGPQQSQQLPPASHYTVMLVVTVQRRLAGEQVRVELDSLDVSVVELEVRQDSTAPAKGG